MDDRERQHLIHNFVYFCGQRSVTEILIFVLSALLTSRTIFLQLQWDLSFVMFSTIKVLKRDYIDIDDEILKFVLFRFTKSCLFQNIVFLYCYHELVLSFDNGKKKRLLLKMHALIKSKSIRRGGNISKYHSFDTSR